MDTPSQITIPIFRKSRSKTCIEASCRVQIHQQEDSGDLIELPSKLIFSIFSLMIFPLVFKHNQSSVSECSSPVKAKIFGGFSSLSRLDHIPEHIKADDIHNSFYADTAQSSKISLWRIQTNLWIKLNGHLQKKVFQTSQQKQSL